MPLYRRKNPSGWILLGLLSFYLLSAVVYLFIPSELMDYINPLYIFTSYLTAILAPLPVSGYYWLMVALLHVLPLGGWLLLCFHHKIGKPLVLVPYTVLLLLNCAVSFLHFITALAERSMQYLGVTVLLAFISLVQCVAVFVLTLLWQPKRSD